MALATVVLRHAEDAAFLWEQRAAMLRGQRYTHVERVRADGRLEGHIDGLTIAGDFGLASALELLETYGGAGEVFATAVVAFALHRENALAHILGTVECVDDARRALVAASGWNTLDCVRPQLLRWASSSEPRLRSLAVACLAAHRASCGGWLGPALRDDDIEVRARAARAAGQLGAMELGDVLCGLLSDARQVAIEATLSLARLHTNSREAHSALVDAIRDPGCASRAVSALVQMAPSEACDLIRSLSEEPVRRGLATTAIEELGDPAFIPTLLEWMGDDGLAPRAGQALSSITGLDLVSEGLISELDDVGDEVDEGCSRQDRDAAQPLPSRWLVARCWQSRRESWTPRLRYLEGMPVGRLSSALDWDNLVALRKLMTTGRPRHRGTAARMLAQALPSLPLVETRAPATRMHVQPGLAPWLELALPSVASAQETA